MLNAAHDRGVATVGLPADVDAANADIVGEGIIASVGNASSGVVIDLSATRYLDSAGIDMLFRLNERMQARRQRLHLVVASDSPLMRVLRIVAIPDVMPIHPDVESAIAAAAAASAGVDAEEA